MGSRLFEMSESHKGEMTKIPAICPVFDECGGCQHQDISYPDELNLKETALKRKLKESLNLSEKVFQPILASPRDYYYRNRLDLKLIQTKSKEIFIGFSPKDRHRLIPVDSCPIAREEISKFIPSVKEQAKSRVKEKHRQANLVSRTGDDGRVFWGGIGRRSLELQPEDYLWTEILGRKIFYSLDTFFQANLYILPPFMERLRALPIWDKEAIFYDLYGGVGLFGMCVYDLVRQVVLIEEVPASLRLARHNAAYNRCENYTVLDGRVEDILPAQIALMPQSTNIVMVDPPRAGLSDKTIEMLNSLDHATHLLYLSCNPQSLLENCQTLRQHWSIQYVLPMDFFPRTQHLETLVLFHPVA